jgi:hypothetical protein
MQSLNFKRIAGAIALVLLLIVLLVRVLPPGAERQAAIAVLAQPIPQVHGKDGSDAQWLLRYDVPEPAQAAAADAVRRYLARHDDLRIRRHYEEADALPDPRDAFKKFPEVDREAPWLCKDKATDCLAVVRSDPRAVAAAVARHAAALAVVHRFTTFDGTRIRLKPSLSQEAPCWGCQRQLVRTSFALEFIQGRHAQALSRVCADIAGWRRLGADTDLLIQSMVSAAYVRQDLVLMSEMLAELPQDVALPEECEAALAPTRPAELGICQTVKREYAAAVETFVQIHDSQEKTSARVVSRIAVDADHAAAVLAPAYAGYCGEKALLAARADRPAISASPTVDECSVFENIGDPVGCWLVRIGSGDWLHRYQDRRTDLAAQLALMRALVWVRTHGSGEPALDFGKRPASLGLRRTPQVSPDGTQVSIPLFDTKSGATFTLKLRS